MILQLLLLLLPSQLAIHFWPNWSFINGIRVDYLSPTLYLTDIIILLLFIKSKCSAFSVQRSVIILVVFNILFSVSPFVTIYKWLRVYEYFWLFKYLQGTRFMAHGSKALMIAIIWTCLLAWMQFINQGSIGGLWYWLGERTFNVSTPGIAKLDLGIWDLGFVLRPYATMPHPNALAGFLLISGLLLGAWSLVIAIPTILITFSRTIIVGLLGPLVLFFPGNPSSLSERIDQVKTAIVTIQHYPLFGTGLGNFMVANQILQPVHNIYLLLISELGIPLFLLSAILITKNLKLSFPTIVILLIGLVDHYWVTLHQNILLLVVMLSCQYHPLNPPLKLRGGDPAGRG